MDSPGWSTVSSREAYANQWIRVLHDDVIRPDGTPGIYGVLELRAPAVFVVAIDDEDRVLLVHLNRYTTGPGWEIPAGGSDGEDPFVAGQRELLEETGVVATSWQRIGDVVALNGIARAPGIILLAQDLHVPVLGGCGAAEEGITGTQFVEWSELGELIAAGEIRDSETLAALTSAAVAMGRWG